MASSRSGWKGIRLNLRFTRSLSRSGLLGAPLIGLFIVFALCLAGCSSLLQNLQWQKQPIQDTRTALEVQQTRVEGIVQTGTAEGGQSSATALALKTTRAASQVTPTVQQTTPPPALLSTASPETAKPGALISKMESARILLYEDMAARRDTNRYAKDTLDRMGLAYVDVGDAQGRLKNELISHGGGDGWDLIIIASESKPGISGEFFEYVNRALDQGSAIILEVRYMDQVANGVAKTLLSRCGIEFERNWENVPPDQRVMFPLQPTHPILNDPNSGLSFTRASDYWWDPENGVDYDIGDWMKLSPGSQAQLVIGALTGQGNAHGTVTVCVDGRLILQTFSSHILTFNNMEPLWENYIYNALKISLKIDS
jgi:hypothetical protein